MSIYYQPGAEGLTDHDEKDAVISALQAALESFGKSMQVLKKERDEAREEVARLQEVIAQCLDCSQILSAAKEAAK